MTKLLPGTEWCDTCGGEGHVWIGRGPDERKETCETCGGHKMIDTDDVTVTRAPTLDEALAHIAAAKRGAAENAAIERLASTPTGAEGLLEAAVDQNAAMRAEIAHYGNQLSELEKALGVDPANEDGSWPNPAGRMDRILAALRAQSK